MRKAKTELLDSSDSLKPAPQIRDTGYTERILSHPAPRISRHVLLLTGGHGLLSHSICLKDRKITVLPNEGEARRRPIGVGERDDDLEGIVERFGLEGDIDVVEI